MYCNCPLQTFLQYWNAPSLEYQIMSYILSVPKTPGCCRRKYKILPPGLSEMFRDWVSVTTWQLELCCDWLSVLSWGLWLAASNDQVSSGPIYREPGYVVTMSLSSLGSSLLREEGSLTESPGPNNNLTLASSENKWLSGPRKLLLMPPLGSRA